MTLTPAPLWKRILAAVYDGLAVIGLLMGVFVVVFVTAILILGKHAVIEEHVLWGSWIVRSIMLLSVFIYFHLSWRKGGQTLGMKSWRLYVIRPDKQPIALWQSALRFISGLLVIGWLWCLVDPQKRALQDIVSNTRLLQKAPAN